MNTKYTIKDFNHQYPNDDACLHEVFLNRYGKLKVCPKCTKTTHFYKVTDRKCYACQSCGHQLHPLANTIFHKSETTLKTWFFAIFLFSNSKNGVSAKELERQLGVTYKTAWRMARQIRSLMNEPTSPMEGHFEVDETYIGGVRPGKRGRGAEGKTPVLGIVQRGGKVRAKVIPDCQANTVLPIVFDNIKDGQTISTDEGNNFNQLNDFGYLHKTIKHGEKQYVNGIVHTNTIDGFWAQLKRGINGSYHSVSRKHLQLYVDEFAFRYCNRFLKSLFPLMIAKAVKPV